MLINVILFASAYIIIPIMYFAMKANTETKDNLIIGVRIPNEHRLDIEIRNIIQRYKRLLLILSIVLTIIPVPVCFIKDFTIAYSIWTSWVLLSIFGYIMLYYISHERIKNIKYTKKMTNQMNNNIVMVDTQVALEKGVYSYHFLYVSASILSFIPVFLLVKNGVSIDLTYEIIGLGSIACVTPIVYLLSIALVHMKGKVISSDSAVNSNYNRVKYRMWNHFLIVMAYMNTIFTWIMWRAYTNGTSEIIEIICALGIELIVFIGFSISTIRKLKRFREKYSDKENSFEMEDDDKYWIGGLVYYNPNDSHLMVEKRFGIGTTMNIATKPGKLVIIFSALCILLLPASCVWIGMEEYTSITLTYESHEISASHGLTHYNIDEHDISNVTLLNTLPSRSRVNGTAMDNLQKGYYNVSGYGRATLCLNPKLDKFIKITDDSGKTYFFSAESDEETLIVFNKLTTVVKKNGGLTD